MDLVSVDFSNLEQHLRHSRGEDECKKMLERLKNFLNRLDLENTKGIQRLILVIEYFTQLSFEQAHHLIDPDGFQDEYEDTLIYNKRFTKNLGYLRSFLGLAPLIWTWYSLFLASNAYQQVNDKSEPFLTLWQGGFHGMLWLTFTWTAVGDVILLGSFLIVTLLTLWIENHSKYQARLFAVELRAITSDLLKVVRAAGISPITTDSDIQRVVDAFKGIVEDLFRNSQDVVKNASEAVTASNERMQELLDSYIGQVISHFGEVITASETLSAASMILADNSTKFANNPGIQVSIDPNLVSSIRVLNSTVQNMVEEFESALKGMKGVVASVSTTSSVMNLSMQEVQKVGELLAIKGLDVETIIERITKLSQEAQQVGEQLRAINNLDIEPIIKQIRIATEALALIETKLVGTTLSLKDAANALSEAQSNGPFSKLKKIFGLRDNSHQ